MPTTQKATTARATSTTMQRVTMTNRLTWQWSLSWMATNQTKHQGVRRFRRRGKGVTKKYANYSLLMAARQARRGGPRRALICKGCVFFSADNLRDAKPIPKEDREEFALGVALVHYSMNAGIKKFETKGKAEVTKELTQMHNTSVFHPIKVESRPTMSGRKPSRCSCSSRKRGTAQ
jgi:hypothetical protein